MVFFSLFITFLFLAYSRHFLVRLLQRISFLATGKTRMTKTFYFLLFFPGVIIHELSHFFMANLLLVSTGEISFFPEKEKMGYVQIAKTDPLRQSLIGLAPTLIGTASILAIFHLVLNLPLKMINGYELYFLLSGKKNLPWLYLIFAINNTMFSSKEDQRSFLGLLVFLSFFATLLYLFNLLPLVSEALLNYATLAAKLISAAYASTCLINLIFITPLFIWAKIIEKI